MMTTHAQLIDEARNHYVRQFQGFVDSLREQWPDGHAEVKFELSQQSDLFRRLYCVDFLAKENDEVIIREMYPDRILTFKPVTFGVGKTTVLIEQLCWDNVQLRHDVGIVGSSVWSQWFDYWFDMEDNRLGPASSTAGIIHSLLVDEDVVTIDMGTSGPEAFWDVIDIISAAGAEKINVNSDRRSEAA